MKTHTGLLRLAMAASALTLLLAGCGKPAETAAAAPAAPAATGNVADVDVTSNVKTALLQDPGLKGFDIAVSTIKGDVRLVGVLDNQAQIDGAVKIARAADGVHSIHDELTVKK